MNFLKMKIQNLKIYKYFQDKIQLIKIRLNTIKNRIKQRFNEYFLLENSLGYLNKILKTFFLISIGFNEINYGYKNSKRFKLCIFVFILLWISLIRLHISINFDYNVCPTNKVNLPNSSYY